MQSSLRNLFRWLLFHKPFGVKDLELCQFAAENQANLLGNGWGSGLLAALDAGKIPGIEGAVVIAKASDHITQAPSTLLTGLPQWGHSTPPTLGLVPILFIKQIYSNKNLFSPLCGNCELRRESPHENRRNH
jgi:hypothetical protein